MGWNSDFKNQKIDTKDPNPWLALFMDKSLPLYQESKRCLLVGVNSNCRRLLLPLVRPLARIFIILVQLLRIFIPESVHSTKILHYSIYWGLKLFVTKEASYLIIRHMNIGTRILRFIADNVEDVKITSTIPLAPRNLKGLIDNTFLIHDINVYNFIYELNEQLEKKGTDIQIKKQLDFSAIPSDDIDIEIDQLPDTWHNFVDLQTAIELYTPLYALFLSDRDFWRASNSLQLDETISIYISKILGDYTPLAIVNNRHPLVPIATLESGFRLMLHGLDAELLHGYLCRLKEGMKIQSPQMKLKDF